MKYLLTNEMEKPKDTDLFKYNVFGDKIRRTFKLNGKTYHKEPFELFTSLTNRKDALTFKKEFNKIAEKILNVRFPIIIRRGYQNGVFYDIYKHRWCCIDCLSNELKEIGYSIKFNDDRLKEFRIAVNKTLKKVYLV